MARCAFPVLVLALAVATIPPAREPLPEVAPPPARALAPEVSEAIAAEIEADAFLLAQLATAEDPRAASAVTWVALNRAGCEVAPLRCERPLLGVVRARRAFGTFHRRAGVWRAAWSPRRLASPRVEREVWDVLQGRVPDPTGGATHFHRLGTWTPPWAPKRAAWKVFGSHAFYLEARL